MDKEAFERKKAERQKKLEEYERQKEERRKKEEERKKNGPRAYKKKEGVTHGRPRKNPKEEPERVTDAGKPSIQEIINQIEDAIAEYKEIEQKYKIYDPAKPYNAFLWAGTCDYVGAKVFKGKQLLQEDKASSNGGSPRFNPDRVNAIYNYYLHITQLHNATPRVCDFADFIGIDKTDFYRSDSLATPGLGHFSKKIMADSEAGLASMLQAGKGSTTGIAMILNVKHGWTQSREVVHTDATSHISARDLPRLGSGGAEALEIGDKE